MTEEDNVLLDAILDGISGVELDDIMEDFQEKELKKIMSEIQDFISILYHSPIEPILRQCKNDYQKANVILGKILIMDYVMEIMDSDWIEDMPNDKNLFQEYLQLKKDFHKLRINPPRNIPYFTDAQLKLGLKFTYIGCQDISLARKIFIDLLENNFYEM